MKPKLVTVKLPIGTVKAARREAAKLECSIGAVFTSALVVYFDQQKITKRFWQTPDERWPEVFGKKAGGQQKLGRKG